MKAVIREGSVGFWASIPFGGNWAGYIPTLVDVSRKPTISNNSDQILIHVHAAALNPVDAKMPKFILGPIMGMEFCGTVVEMGTKNHPTSNIQVGDVVMGPVRIGWSGSLAEYAVGYASKVTKLPKGWTVEEGAAFPIACGSAMDAFQTVGVLSKYRQDNSSSRPPIESILVIGASGGCGIIALQLAKGMGIPRIIAICSAKNTELVKSNGATEVVPYDDPTDAMEAFLQENEGTLECIYDAASYSGGTGGEDYCDNPKVLGLLQKDAKYTMLNGSKYHKIRAVALGKVLGVSLQQSLVVLPKFSSQELALGVELLEKANMKPVVDTSHSFTAEGIREGYEKLKSRRAKGKIVYSISKPDSPTNK